MRMWRPVTEHSLGCDVRAVVPMLIESLNVHFRRNEDRRPDSVDEGFVSHAHTLEPLAVNLRR